MSAVRTSAAAVGGFERLEARACPAAWAHLTHAGFTLVVRGDAAADQVTITQDDARGTLTVTGVDSKSAVFSSAKVGSIQVNLGGGDDRFEYATVHGVRNPKRLNVDLGAGNDTGIIRWADDDGVARRGLTLVANGGTGDDAIGVRVGRLGAGTTVSPRLLGGGGNDALGVQSLAPAAGAALHVVARGGAGADSLGAYSTGNLSASGRAAYDLRGDGGDDEVSVNVAGRINGSFSARLDGGAGDDQISINATNAAGRGRVRATLLGGSGNDQFAALGDPLVMRALVKGGPGVDAGLLPPRVRARSVEQSQPPTPYELRLGPLPTFSPVLPTQTISREGRTVEYHSSGTAKPGQPVVVLMTGFGGDIDYWQTVPGRIADGSQVIAVNRPGYRRSSPAVGDYAQTAVEDIRAVVGSVAGNRPVVLVGHSLGGLYANLYARLHPTEVAGVVFVDSTAPEDVARIDDFGVPFGGLGDPNSPELRLGQPGVRQEIEGVVSLTRQVLGAQAFPLVPVVSLRAGPADLLADDPQLDAWYQALGALGSPGETRRVPDSGHNIQFDRPDAVVQAVSDVLAAAVVVGA